jgi:hypothetical protein
MPQEVIEQLKLLIEDLGDLVWEIKNEERKST